MTTATFSRQVESAVSPEGPRTALRERVLEALAAGMDRDEVYRVLNEIRREFRAEGRTYEEDVVLDVMDMLTDWSGPTSLV